MLKIILILQSIFPLIIIIFVVNAYSFVTDYFDEKIDKNYYHLVLFVFLIVLFLIITYTIISFFLIKNYISHGEELPKTIIEIEKNNKVGLDFFMTYLVPLILCDISNIILLFVLVLVLFFMFILMYRTDIYYINPILIVFGYNLYRIKIKDGNYYNCICKEKLEEKDKIIYKSLSNDILFGRKSQNEK